MKTEFRKLLLLGSSDKDPSAEVVTGIIQRTSILQDKGEHMQAESLVSFLHDLLDFTISPQAESFAHLFHSLEVYHVFQMKLPFLISTSSPHKMRGMKLLHQYIQNKPVPEISIFFSTDASKDTIDPGLQDAYEQFCRFHKR